MFTKKFLSYQEKIKNTFQQESTQKSIRLSSIKVSYWWVQKAANKITQNVLQIMCKVLQVWKLSLCMWQNGKDLGPVWPACHPELLCLMFVYKLVSVGGETAADKSEVSQDLAWGGSLTCISWSNTMFVSFHCRNLLAVSTGSVSTWSRVSKSASLA